MAFTEPSPLLARSESSKASSEHTAGEYAHTLETFVDTLAPSVVEECHLATKHRHVVLFRALSGRWFLFGVEAVEGIATVKYDALRCGVRPRQPFTDAMGRRFVTRDREYLTTPAERVVD